MSSTGLILSPKDVRTILKEWLGKDVECTDIKPLHGGMCSTVLEVKFDSLPYVAVVKLSVEPDPHFEIEAASLDYLRQHSQMRVPEVYLQKNAGDLLKYHVLVMERLPGVNLGQAELTPKERQNIDCQLADILIELHSHKRNTYGLSDSYEDSYESWIDEFSEQITSWVDEGKHLLSRRSSEIIPHLLKEMPRVLEPAGPPTLVHGDIWSTNIIVDQQNGRWIISGLVDPTTQYADVEYEIAYLQVFNTVTDAFFDRYCRTNPLRPGYELRRQYYWLNTMLLHAVCFTDEDYVSRTERVAEELEKALG